MRPDIDDAWPIPRSSPRRSNSRIESSTVVDLTPPPRLTDRRINSRLQFSMLVEGCGRFEEITENGVAVGRRRMSAEQARTMAGGLRPGVPEAENPMVLCVEKIFFFDIILGFCQCFFDNIMVHFIHLRHYGAINKSRNQNLRFRFVIFIHSSKQL